MRKPERTSIEGVTYDVAPLGATKGIALLEDIVKLVGPALAEVPSLAALGSFSGVAIAGLVENLRKGEVVRIALVLAECTTMTADGAPTKLDKVFDTHFAGEYTALTDWLRFALEVNYKRFFDELQARAEAKAKALAAAAAALAASGTTAPAA